MREGVLRHICVALVSSIWFACALVGGPHTAFAADNLVSVTFTDANHGWAVGNNSSGHSTIVSTVDGGLNWRTQCSVSGTDLGSIAFGDATHGWAVGWNGAVFATADGGAHWTRRAVETTTNLMCVDFASVNLGWVSGFNYSGGLSPVLSTRDGGDHWLGQETGGLKVCGIDFANGTTGWAVGSWGEIAKTVDGGEHWYRQVSGHRPGEVTTFDEIWAVDFADESHGWAVGDSASQVQFDSLPSFILRTVDGGATWASRTMTDVAGLSSVCAVDATHAWVVGYTMDQHGVILATADGGATWGTQLSTGVTDAYSPSAVTFVDANRGWAVGRHGAIWATSDGGAHWVRRAPFVSTPVAPSVMRRGRYYSISGFVTPMHTSGTYLVTLQFYQRNSSGRYVYHHSIRAKRYYYSTSRTAYKASVSLPHRGRWRVRAVHGDSEGCGPFYSGYDYITVK